MDTFSVNSLKILQKSKEEFEKKYIQKKELIYQNQEAEFGDKMHKLICYYLKRFNINQIVNSLDDKEKALFLKIKNSKPLKTVLSAEKRFIEQPFFIKEQLNNIPFYLTGRFDAVIKTGDKYTIFDWKTNEIPKNSKNSLQTVVYTFCASKLFKTQNVEMVYYSLSSGKFEPCFFNPSFAKTIKEIVQKAF